MNAFDLASAAVDDPSSLSHIPDTEFRDHVLAQVRTGFRTVKASMVRRDDAEVCVWLWVADSGMPHISDRSIANLARSRVRVGESVRRVVANVYSAPGRIGGEALEYIYYVEKDWHESIRRRVPHL